MSCIQIKNSSVQGLMDRLPVWQRTVLFTRVSEMRESGSIHSIPHEDGTFIGADVVVENFDDGNVQHPQINCITKVWIYGVHEAHLPKTIDLNTSISLERNGIRSEDASALIGSLGIAMTRALEVFKMPKSTAFNKIKNGGQFVGAEALPFIRLIDMFYLAASIVSNSLHPDAKNFDVGKWLGEWIERPQPSLGGAKPADFMDTVAGGQRVIETLAAIESGSYQ